MPSLEKEKSKPTEARRKPGAMMTPRAAAIWKRLRANQQWAGGHELSLLLHLNRVGRGGATEMEAAAGFSLPQMRILFEAMDEEGVSQSALHKQYQVDPGSITRTVQAMERDGLVTRQVDANDNRLMRVYTTEKGRALAEELPQRLAAFERAITADLTADEVNLLHSLLEKIDIRLSEAMQARGEDSGIKG